MACCMTQALAVSSALEDAGVQVVVWAGLVGDFSVLPSEHIP